MVHISVARAVWLTSLLLNLAFLFDPGLQFVVFGLGLLLCVRFTLPFTNSDSVKGSKRKRRCEKARKPPRDTMIAMFMGSFVAIYAIIDPAADRVTSTKECTPTTDTTSVYYPATSRMRQVVQSLNNSGK